MNIKLSPFLFNLRLIFVAEIKNQNEEFKEKTQLKRFAFKKNLKQFKSDQKNEFQVYRRSARNRKILRFNAGRRPEDFIRLWNEGASDPGTAG
jgi:hypothetical protein